MLGTIAVNQIFSRIKSCKIVQNNLFKKNKQKQFIKTITDSKQKRNIFPIINILCKIKFK